MKIFLVRHGETTGDVKNIFGGEYDDHLTRLGRTQAEELTRKLINKNIQAIFVSPKIRTIETAKIFKKHLSPCEFIIHELLRVRNHYGVLTGLPEKKATKLYPHLVELLTDTKNTIEGGEPYQDFVNRSISALKQIIKECKAGKYESIAIVTHRGVIRAIVREYLKIGEVKIDHSGYIELECNQRKIEVKHLEDAKYERLFQSTT